MGRSRPLRSVESADIVGKVLVCFEIGHAESVGTLKLIP